MNYEKKYIIVTILMVTVAAAIGAGLWYYFSRIRPTPIEKIVSNPTVYIRKEVTIEGNVTDRTAFFGVLRFYKVRDKSGVITVVTGKSLPEMKSEMIVKGKLDDSFPLGDQKLVVLMEDSTKKKDKSK